MYAIKSLWWWGRNGHLALVFWHREKEKKRGKEHLRTKSVKLIEVSLLYILVPFLSLHSFFFFFIDWIYVWLYRTHLWSCWLDGCKKKKFKCYIPIWIFSQSRGENDWVIQCSTKTQQTPGRMKVWEAYKGEWKRERKEKREKNIWNWMYMGVWRHEQKAFKLKSSRWLLRFVLPLITRTGVCVCVCIFMYISIYMCRDITRVKRLTPAIEIIKKINK